MKKKNLLLLLIPVLWNLYSSAQTNPRTSVASSKENNIDVSQQMEQIVSRKNGTYETYKYSNGYVAYSKVQDGDIVSMYVKSPTGTIMPMTMKKDGKVRCYAECDDGHGHSFRLQIKCPKIMTNA